MALETAMVGLPLPMAISLLSDFLARNGFRIEVYSVQEQRLTLYQEGGWFAQSRRVVLDLSPVDENRTRIEVSAYSGKSVQVEDILTEEKLAAAITRKWMPIVNPMT